MKKPIKKIAVAVISLSISALAAIGILSRGGISEHA